jgi:hypothetical protein
MWRGLSFLAASEAGESLRRSMRSAVAMVASAIAAFTGVVFALVALHAWLSQRMTFIEASLVISAAFLFLALVFFIIAGFIRRSRRPASALATSAIVAAPIALRLIGSRLDLRAVGIAGMLTLGAILGRQLGRIRP